MTTALVTGASGYLGSRIATSLVASGRFARVVGTDIATGGSPGPGWSLVGGVDLSDESAVKDLFSDVAGSPGEDLAVLHVAAFPGPSAEAPPPVTPARASPIHNRIGLENVSGAPRSRQYCE